MSWGGLSLDGQVFDSDCDSRVFESCICLTFPLSRNRDAHGQDILVRDIELGERALQALVKRGANEFAHIIGGIVIFDFRALQVFHDRSIVHGDFSSAL